MVNFPPIDTVSNNRVTTTKRPTTQRVMASTATASRESHPQIDRRKMRDRRRGRSKQLMDRRMLRDRRRSSIDFSV